MDDQHEHFLGIVSDLCLAAELGQLEVELITSDGARARGVPTTLRAADSNRPTNRPGQGGRIRLQALALNLGDVVECKILAGSQP